ncbi:MAG: Calx-beta domain-containing protein [Pyrinomonadaceae bacterium]
MAGYSISESGGAFNATVMRAGSSASVTTVNYRTSDTAGLDNCSVLNGNASARCDYTTVVGTLRFGVGETSKNISIPIIDDSYAEATESFSIVLSDVTGGTLGATGTAILSINDNEASNGPNPIDGTPFFVRQQYLDFPNREPDPAGNAAWQAVINNCPAGDTTCDRIHVSSAFFRSPEFQDRGYFVYRFYPVAFGRKPEYVEFVPDLAKVSGFLSDAELEAAKVAFITEFITRPAFGAKFNGLTNTQYVDTLLATAGVTSPHRDFWIAALGNGTRTRATVLRDISESPEVYNKYYNQAFVVMQYFGYLRRDPDALYLNWIAVLDANPNDYRGMVNGFMNSLEYRFRFGP